MSRRLLCILILVLIAAPLAVPLDTLQAQPPRQGSSPSTILYDFETGTTEGWKIGTGGAIAKIGTSMQVAYSKQNSLKLPVDLANRTQGNVRVALNRKEFPNLLNLTGQTLFAWVYAPLGARGDPTQPNSLKLFVESVGGGKLYGTSQSFLEGGWFQIKLTVPQAEPPACGMMTKNFNPAKVNAIGLNIARSTKSTSTFKGDIFLDKIEMGTLPTVRSDYFYDFQGTAATTRQPSWRLLPGWNATGFSSLTINNGALAASAQFTLASNQTRKGVIGIAYSPALDLSHKDNTIISADVSFDQTAIQVKNSISTCPFVVSIRAFDDRKQKWFVSDDINVGTGERTHISFDIADAVQYQPGTQIDGTDLISLDDIRQVAFQFWANDVYSGTVLIDNIAIGGQELPRANVNDGIVQAKNGKFMLNNQPYRFVGANAEYLVVEDTRNVASVLDQAAAIGINVVRVWGFGEGCENSDQDCDIWSRRFQPSRGQWNEAAFKHFDQVVAMAAERGIRLIVPFANNWKDYGGKPQYVEWLKNEYPEDIITGLLPAQYEDLFYTNAHIKQWYQDYVAYFLSRTNSLTGVRYVDDPTIFAWELMNEPRAKSDQTGATLHNWIVEMSQYIDTLDPKHMIGTGEEGWYIMTQPEADKRARLPNGQQWQTLPDNYWQYGVNWNSTNAGNGADFISDHSSQDTNVCWQATVNATQQSATACETRKGVPQIDFASAHVYIDPEASNLHLAPYCDMKFGTYLCNSFDFPYNQALTWIDRHARDANVLEKPLLLGEFGFHKWDAFGAYSNSGLPGNLPVNGVPSDWVPLVGSVDQSSIQRQLPPSSPAPNGQSGQVINRIYIEPVDRARFFKWYLEEMATSGVNGAMFWNLGYDGFLESTWANTAVHSLDDPLPWNASTASDATNIAIAVLPESTTHSRYAACVSYDPQAGKKGAFIFKNDIQANDANWVNTPQFRFDVYSETPAFAIVRLATGANQTHYESVPIPVAIGWNTVTVDVTKPVWRSVSAQTRYDNIVGDITNIQQVGIGLVGYPTAGTFCIDRVRVVYDDSFVVYPGDPTLDAMKEAIYQYW